MAKSIAIEINGNGYPFAKFTLSGFKASDTTVNGKWIGGLSDIKIVAKEDITSITVSGETIFVATEVDSDIEINGSEFSSLDQIANTYFMF